MTIVIIKIGRVILNIIYFFFKLKPSTNKVTMISRQSNTPSDEFLMIKKEIESRNRGTRVVMLCHTLDGKENSSISTRVKYAFHIFTQMHHIASSKVVLLDTYCIPVSLLKHKKNLTIIQMWHSMGAMKKCGYAVVDTKEGVSRKLAEAMRMHANYDAVFVSAEAYKHCLATDFNTDINKIITMPLPRLDKLINDKTFEEEIQRKIYNKYPILKDKPVILYAPTFRMDENGFVEAVEALVKAFDTEHYQIVVSLHPLSKVKEQISAMKGVLVPGDFDSFEMIFVADYMISDYSCIIYEAAVRDIPLFFYNYDYDSYIGERGLEIDYYKELPGVISKVPSDIARAIEEHEIGCTYNMEELRRFSDKYVRRTEHATKDIVDYIYKFI